MARSQHVPRRLVALLLVAWGLMVYRVGVPWYEFHNANGAWISASIRNFKQYSFTAFHMLHTRQAGPTTPADFHPYIHHPPMPVWLPGFLSIFTGLNEVTVRFVFISATLLSVAALYVLTRRLFDERTAWWASFLYVFMPMTTYFGRSPDYFMISMAVGVVYTAIYWNWLQRPTWRRFGALALLAVFGVYTFWVDILYVGVLGIIALFIGKWTHRIQTVILGVIGIAAVASMLLLYAWGAPTVLQDMRAAALIRTGVNPNAYNEDDFRLTDYVHGSYNRRSETLPDETFTWLQFAVDVVLDLTTTMTTSFLVLGVLGTPAAFRITSWRRRWILIGLYGVSLLWVLLLRNASYTHHFYSIYFFIPIAICGAVILMRPRHRWRWLHPLLVALVITGVINGLYLYGVYHSSGGYPHMILGEREIYHETTIEALRTWTEADDLVMTNIDWLYENMAMEYYANRNVIWGTQPVQAVVEARTVGESVQYMYCVDAPEVPPGFEAYTYHVAQNGCWFFNIPPE